jgi:hypothetical protein
MTNHRHLARVGKIYVENGNQSSKIFLLFLPTTDRKMLFCQSEPTGSDNSTSLNLQGHFVSKIEVRRRVRKRKEKSKEQWII